MPGKRFRARRRYARSRLWALSAFLFVTVAFLIFLVQDHQSLLRISPLVVVAGSAIAWWLDRRERIAYAVEGGNLLLSRNGAMERLPIASVLDASLLDRRAAREFLLARKQSMRDEGLIQAEQEEFQRRFLQWCSVDIGLGLSGLVRGLVERQPDGKYDLVLLRLQDGRSLLLSPVYNQDLISALNKGKGGESYRSQHRA